MKKTSMYLDKYFLSPSECTKLLKSIYSVKERFSLFRVPAIDGEISAHVPAIAKISREIQKLVDDFSESPLAVISNAKEAINIHFTPPGGEYGWHYDRNEVKAILYLNQVQGGEVEVYEDYRILLNSQFSSIQNLLDKILRTKLFRWIFSKKHSMIQPAAGELLLFKADRCLHSARQIRGNTDRVTIEFIFDVPGKVLRLDSDPNPYLYSGPEFAAERISA
jgi:hypothetical protein